MFGDGVDAAPQQESCLDRVMHLVRQHFGSQGSIHVYCLHDGSGTDYLLSRTCIVISIFAEGPLGDEINGVSNLHIAYA